MIAAAGAWSGSAAPLRAQLPANARWQTIASAHFRITYGAGLEELARHAAASAERAHAALRYLVANPPAGAIDIVLTDNVDYTNGYATPLPSNRVVIYAKPPVDVLELQYTRDWIDLVVTHELAHTFHLDVSGGFGRLVRAIFGRVPSPWPVFPAFGTPAWSVEGLAVGVESNVAGLGRLHGSYHEMVVRTAALEAKIDDIHRLSSSSPEWPGGTRVYIYGSLFMDYIARRFGPDAIGRIVRNTANAIIPPPLWFGSVAERTLGATFVELYADWERELEERYDSVAARLGAAGLTQAQPLTRHPRIALYPRFAPDSRHIAYTRSDGRTEARTVVMDAETGVVAWTRSRNDVASSAWLDATTLLTSDLQYVDRFHIFSDLYRVQRGDRDRLTHGARLQDADVTGAGDHIVAVENGGGTNRLVLIDVASGERRALVPFEPALHWSLPRWSPDGSRIAVGRWQTGGRFDVVVIDTTGSVLLEIGDTIGVNTGPAWSPDGQWLVFASDRTGIMNLYAAAVMARADNGAPTPTTRVPLRQITNVLTGAYFPDVSPDGRWLVFAAYHHDGFRIERMPFDPASWREPQRPLLEQLAQQRPAHVTQIRPNEFYAAVHNAVAHADTIAGPAQPYRALRSAQPYFWLPVLESHARDDYFGVFTFGNDLVGRHTWSFSAAAAPGSGRTIADVSYTYQGLPAIRALSLQPSISAAFEREWDEVGRDTSGIRIDEREDRGSLALGLSWLRWRRSLSLSFSGELVRRARDLLNAPDTVRLIDPADDLWGLRAGAGFASYVSPAFAISRENGFVLQLAVRERWDRDPTEVRTSSGTRVFDSGYRELTTWDAAYLALPLSGFARHVLAARFSMLYRDGPGASTSGIGEASGTGFGISGFIDQIGGSSRLLPVRGFPSNARRGTRAWTASGEYRAPLTMLSRSLAPLPIYLDRLAGSVFADAGHAWCDSAQVFRSCASTSPSDTPLLSAGAELTSFMSFWGAAVPLRIGVGIPLQGGRDPRVHIAAGAAF